MHINERERQGQRRVRENVCITCGSESFSVMKTRILIF